MAQITIYGASDDLIEIDGDINEEFNVLGKEKSILAFSNGTVLRMEYGDDGTWQIRPLVVTEEFEFHPAVSADDDNYSDTVVMRGDIKWVVLGSEIARAC